MPTLSSLSEESGRLSPAQIAERAGVPFIGLRPFFEADAPLFYGRGAQIRGMLSKLRNCRFLAVVGGSGSGKSSLVQAGLIPAIRRHALGPSALPWKVVSLRPGSAPLRHLAEALLVEFAPPVKQVDSPAAGNSPPISEGESKPTVAGGGGCSATSESYARVVTRRELASGRLGLQGVLEALDVPVETPVLVLVDQFEELFRFHQQEHLTSSESSTLCTRDGRQNQAQKFVKLLLAAAAQTERPISIVLTMRSDYLGDCAIFSGLPEAINDAQFLTPRMSRQQLRNAITGPLELFGATADPALVDQLLNDADSEVDALPLLQHVLLQCWKRACQPLDSWRERSIVLKLEHYIAIGGNQGALNSHLERIFQELDGVRLTGVQHSAPPSMLTRVLGSLAEYAIFTRRACEFLMATGLADWPRSIARRVARAASSVRGSEVHGGSTESGQTMELPSGRSVAPSARGWWWRWSLGILEAQSDFLLATIIYWLRRLEWLLARRRVAMRPVPGSRQVCERMFRTLSSVNEAGQPIRRFASVNDIAGLAEVSAADVMLVAAPFMASNRTFLVALTAGGDRSPLSGETVLDVCHEVLLRHWWRCRRWIAVEQRRGTDFDQLARSAQRNKTLDPVELDDLTDWWIQDRPNLIWAQVHLTPEKLQKLDPPRVETATSPAVGEGTGGSGSEHSTEKVAEAVSFSDQAGAPGTPPAAAERLLQELRDRQRQVFATASAFIITSIWRQIGWSLLPVVTCTMLFLLMGILIEFKESESQTRREAEKNLAIADARLYAGRIYGAEREFNERNLKEARGRLNSTRWDLARDRWEYRHVSLQLHSPHVVWTGHSGPVLCAAYNGTGERLASAGEDLKIRIWDSRTGNLHKTLSGHTDRVTSVAFSPDGTRLASGSHDTTVCLWNVETGELERRLDDSRGYVSCVAFSPDGEHVVAANDDTTIWIFSVTSGDVKTRLRGHRERVNWVSFSPDGRRLASAGEDSSVQIWDFDTGSVVRTLAGHAQPVAIVTFNLDGTQLATAAQDGVIRLWDPATGSNELTLPGMNREVRSLAFNRSGTHLAAGGVDESVILWDVETGSIAKSLTGHFAAVRCLAFNPQDGSLASGADDQTIRIWPEESQREERLPQVSSAQLHGLALSPDGVRLASSAGPNSIELTSLADDRRIVLAGHSDWVRTIAFSPDALRLASGSRDGVRFWDAATGERQGPTISDLGQVSCLAYRPGRDGTALAVAGEDGRIQILNPISGAVARTLAASGSPITCLAFSPEGARLAAGYGDRIVRIWDPQTGKLFQTLAESDSDIRCMGYSPDGKCLAWGGASGAVGLWKSLAAVGTEFLSGHADEVGAIVFLGTSNRLATGAKDGNINVWDLTSGEAVHTIVAHASEITGLVYDLRSKTLISASQDSEIRLWRTARSESARTLAGRLGLGDRLAFSPDGQRVAAEEGEHSIRVWSTQTGETERTIRGLPSGELRLAFRPDGKCLVGAIRNTKVIVYEPDDGKGRRTLFEHSNQVSAIAFDGECRQIATAAADGSLQLHELSTGRLVRQIRAHNCAIADMAFSRDGMRIVSGGGDQLIRIWNVKSGKLERELEGHREGVECVAFSPDGSMVASVGLDGTVRLCNLMTGGTKSWPGGAAGVSRVAFSHDGSRLVGAGSDWLVRIWDGRTLELLRTLSGHSNAVTDVVFDSTGTQLGSISRDGTMRIWYQGEHESPLSGSENWY